MQYAILKQDVMDIPSGSRVLVISRFYGGVEGKCYLYVEPHPTDPDCDWSNVGNVPEEWLEYEELDNENP